MSTYLLRVKVRYFETWHVLCQAHGLIPDLDCMLDNVLELVFGMPWTELPRVRVNCESHVDGSVSDVSPYMRWMWVTIPLYEHYSDWNDLNESSTPRCCSCSECVCARRVDLRRNTHASWSTVRSQQGPRAMAWGRLRQIPCFA